LYLAMINRLPSVVVCLAVLTAGCASSRSSLSPPVTGSASIPAGSVPISESAHSGSAVELTAQVSSAAPDDEGAATEVATGEEGLTLALLDHLSASTAGNVTVSPMSLAVALAMLADGAHGATLSQIDSVLGTPTIDPAARNSGWATLLSGLDGQSLADRVTMQSADALWLQHGLEMNNEFMADMARYFRTGVWQVDFSDNLPAAVDAINKWVTTNTDGKITTLFNTGDIDTSTMLVLANAVYFHANWQDPFDPAASHPGVFYAAGGTSTVTFMHQVVPSASISSGFDEVRLSYTGGDFQAVAIMPTGGSLKSFVDSLTVSGLNQILVAPQQRADIQLPRFSDDGYLNLNQTLSAMGMPLAFSPEADFSAMSTTPLQVQSVGQRDYLNVAEKGTEAAAATGISAMPASATAGATRLPRIKFDHPFVFLIRDTTTGAILFASVMNTPH
jgi:serpin B